MTLEEQVKGCMGEFNVAYTYQNEGEGEHLLLNPAWVVVHDQMTCISNENNLLTLDNNPLVFKSYKEAKGALAVLQVLYKEELKDASLEPYDPTKKMIQVPLKKSILL